MTDTDAKPITGVLLVPAREHFVALLGNGPCGGVVPHLLRGATCGHAFHQEWCDPSDWVDRDCYMCRYPERALVLAWEGRVVREGRDRLGYTLLDAAGWDAGSRAAAPFWRAVHVGTRDAWRAVGFAWVLDRGNNPIDFGYPDGLPNALVAAYDVTRVAAARGLGRVEVVRG
jgi:hypothetical protein